MQQKGWYNVKNANMNDVQTATQKFQTMQQNMQHDKMPALVAGLNI